jgi:TrmH family RNA methyltransferase
MISKNRIKQVVALQRKKDREISGTYVIEGDKIVKEYLRAGRRLKLLAAKPEFISSLKPEEKDNIDEIEFCSFDDLKKMSTLKTPHNALALIPFPEAIPASGEILGDLCVALDFVQDPGNLGTIIRAAAWFDIKNIVCSYNCVDLYNPKVIQSSMGAVLNVSVVYTDLKGFLREASDLNYPVYGAVLDGDPVYGVNTDNKGVILLGNESKGISPDLISLISEKIMIPKFNKTIYGVESLNVSMAASIIFSEFRRGNMYIRKDL